MTRRIRVSAPELTRAAAGSTAGEEETMAAIKAAKTGPRERASAQNGLPEPVPYVYREQKRRNTYAARIARRNAQGWWQPPDLAGGRTKFPHSARGIVSADSVLGVNLITLLGDYSGR